MDQYEGLHAALADFLEARKRVHALAVSAGVAIPPVQSPLVELPVIAARGPGRPKKFKMSPTARRHMSAARKREWGLLTPEQRKEKVALKFGVAVPWSKAYLENRTAKV